MKEYIKKTVRSISAKPIIGRPVRILVAIVRLPQMRDMVFDVNQQMNEINQQISTINQQISTINQQIKEANQKQRVYDTEYSSKVDEINNQINEISKHQHAFDTQHLPDLLESLNYQENLKKSLPVVLRKHHRSIKSIDG